jgi:DNA-binding MarR family transcriptional regulator
MVIRRAPQAPSPDEVEAWYAVGRAYHRCVAELARRVADLHLNLTEHEVLMHLLSAPGLSQQRLAGRVFTAKSYLSNVVRGLEERGLLARSVDANDSRAWSLRLTPAGQRLAQRALQRQHGLIAAMGEGVSAIEQQQFARVLAQIEGNLLAMKAGSQC